jgi:serine/threonine protein kinase
LQKLNHPNLIQFYEKAETDQCYFIFQEFFPSKTLLEYVNEKRGLSERDSCKIFSQICETLGYLHQNHISHGDLKLDNILIGNDQIKIIDFGLACETEKKEFSGSIDYCPPEGFSGKQFSGEKADIWSVGVILYSMITGMLPFQKSTNSEIAKSISNSFLFFI